MLSSLKEYFEFDWFGMTLYFYYILCFRVAPAEVLWRSLAELPDLLLILDFIYKLLLLSAI
jgi:hypothetical protein